MPGGEHPVLSAGNAHARLYPARPCQHAQIPVVAVMQIIIPTRGRIYEQLTLQSLPGELRRRTTLVCPKREASSLYRLYNDLGVKIVIEPYPNMKLAQKRGWIVQEWFRC